MVIPIRVLCSGVLLVVSRRQLWGFMTKSELIEKIILAHPEISPAKVEEMVNGVFGSIKSALAAGNRVEIRGFGSFFVRERSARMARNPRTGDKVEVGEKALPFFRPGKAMRESVNG